MPPNIAREHAQPTLLMEYLHREESKPRAPAPAHWVGDSSVTPVRAELASSSWLVRLSAAASAEMFTLMGIVRQHPWTSVTAFMCSMGVVRLIGALWINACFVPFGRETSCRSLPSSSARSLVHAFMPTRRYPSISW